MSSAKHLLSSDGCDFSGAADYSGFFDPGLDQGLFDPEMGFGSIEAALPSGSTQNSDGTYTAPDGTQWSCDSSENCLQIIGHTATSVTPMPVIFIYGYDPGSTGLGQPPDLIAAIAPTPGAACPNVPQAAELGANMPITQSKNVVINISCSAINNTQNGIAGRLTTAQINQFYKVYPIHGRSKGSGPCFTSSLPKTQWG